MLIELSLKTLDSRLRLGRCSHTDSLTETEPAGHRRRANRTLFAAPFAGVPDLLLPTLALALAAAAAAALAFFASSASRSLAALAASSSFFLFSIESCLARSSSSRALR